MAERNYPCHIEAPHPEHDWTPLVRDPEHERMLHVGLATLRCKGVSVSEWLRQRRATGALRDE